MSGKPQSSVRDRIFDRCVMGDGSCIYWTGRINNWGYGTIGIGKQKTYAVHRVVYEMFRGPIPTDFQIDHICRVRHCVNPGHLQAVTAKRNQALVKLRNTHCPQGHPYASTNLYYGPFGERRCRSCTNRWAREHKARKRSMKEDS